MIYNIIYKINLRRHRMNNKEITIRSSAAEYLTYVASIGEQENSIEVRYEDENI